MSVTISQFNNDRDAEVEGFLLSNNTLVHLPPRAALRIENSMSGKLLMDRVRSPGGSQSIDTKQLFQGLVKETLEAFLELEMEEHLGYAKHDSEGRGSGNSRHRAPARQCAAILAKSRSRRRAIANSSFEPKIVAKRQTSVSNFSEAVISLYARRLTTCEIEQHVKEIYGVEISPQSFRAPLRRSNNRSRVAKPAAGTCLPDRLCRWATSGLL